MASTRWPLVASYLLATLPTLPGWTDVLVVDTDLVTQAVPLKYAVIGRTSDDTTSGSYVRMLMPSTLVNETGTVRVLVVVRTGDADPAPVRADGFALVDALQAALEADQDLGGILGNAGTVSLTVDVQSVANAGGIAQSLVVSVNYTALV